MDRPHPPHRHVVRPASLTLDKDEFRVGTYEPRTGRSAKMSFNIHPGYVDQLDLIFQGRLLPFDTIEAVMRYCIKVGSEELLAKLDELSPDKPFNSIMEHLRIQDRILAEEERMLGFVEHLKHIEDVIGRVAEMPGGVRQAVKDLWAETEAMPSGYWRAVYRKLFRQRFSAWLKRTPHGANLVPIVDLVAQDEEEIGDGDEFDDAIDDADD